MQLSRQEERKLLFLASLYLATGIMVFYLPEEGEKAFRMAVSMVGAAFLPLLVSFFLDLRLPAADKFLLPLTALLTYTGLVFLWRLNPQLAWRQFFWILIAHIFLLAVLFLDFRNLERYQYTYIIIALFILLLALIFGKETYGARSWLQLGLFSFQPSEFGKIFLVLFLSSFLAEKKDLLLLPAVKGRFWEIPSLAYLGPLLLMWGLSLLLLVFQRDLGTALIFFATFLTMIYVATERLSYVVGGLSLFAAGSYLCYLIFGHVRTRIEIWLNPWADIEGKGYQIVQSLFAIGSGGVFGRGLGLGFPRLIPVVETDFIFAAIAEEMGFLGAAGLILVYLIFLYRGFKLAMRASTNFGRLLAAGLTSLFTLQAFVIIGGVIKLMPLTGITLPFVSYGGSSIVANYVLLGLLLNISGREEER
ncbi:MAG: hypothetical protein PWQ91_705 [Eubacteriales bacterium]|nr:hypothetical protein [Eubacteriales bacterium]MDN5363644.1 hypothetical protein [Eubacteriales bacterium]